MKHQRKNETRIETLKRHAVESKRYRENNPEVARASFLRTYNKYKEKYLLSNKLKARENRRQVIEYYSKGKMKCASCGEDDLVVLCIDHINNDGAEQRKLLSGGTKFYRWVINNNFPTGFQVLCHNCNYRKEYYRRQAKANASL